MGGGGGGDKEREREGREELRVFLTLKAQLLQNQSTFRSGDRRPILTPSLCRETELRGGSDFPRVTQQSLAK